MRVRIRPLGGRRTLQPGPEELPVELGNLVLDKDLIDEEGRRAGKIDDIVLGLTEPGPDGTVPLPVVEAILSGPFAFAERMPGFVQAVVRLVYRVLGVPDPHPVTIPWEDIIAIDVVVHVHVDRERQGMLKLQEAVERRIIGHIPGAYIGCEED